MKLTDAMAIIDTENKFLVHFEWCGDGFLRGDYFPDPHEGESGFKTEREAEDIGSLFADLTKGKTCNFYLVDADTFKPTGNWKIANR